MLGYYANITGIIIMDSTIQKHHFILLCTRIFGFNLWCFSIEKGKVIFLMENYFNLNF